MSARYLMTSSYVHSQLKTRPGPCLTYGAASEQLLPRQCLRNSSMSGEIKVCWLASHQNLDRLEHSEDSVP
eukprot:scaffold2043_cov166-Amphora_coffeaeformis.AAC.27